MIENTNVLATECRKVVLKVERQSSYGTITTDKAPLSPVGPPRVGPPRVGPPRVGPPRVRPAPRVELSFVFVKAPLPK